MNVQVLTAAPPAELAAALARFETQFTYPLGPGRSFHIDHGSDYPRFFRAMGEAACFVVADRDDVLGVVGIALRDLRIPKGSVRRVAYVGDLKIAPAARRTGTLLTIANAVRRWIDGRAVAGYGVVMDGTHATPPAYTGIWGIPLAQELGKVMVLRLPCAGPSARDPETADTEPGAVAVPGYAAVGSRPEERSEIRPRWLVAADGRASGYLEDTRRAKRLIADDGQEMVSAHLSRFRYADTASAGALLRRARAAAGAAGFPALFVAVPAPEAPAVTADLTGLDVVAAPATVFGAGLVPHSHWWLDTAEI